MTTQKKPILRQLIADEAVRRSAGNRDLLLIDISDQRFPELLRQLLKYITQWRGHEDRLVEMVDKDTALQAIAVLRTALARQRPAPPPV